MFGPFRPTAYGRTLLPKLTGQQVTDAGRIIRDIDLRDGDGVPVTFHSIGFLDVAALSRHFARHPSAAIRASAPTPSSRVLVSATLASQPHSATLMRRLAIT